MSFPATFPIPDCLSVPELVDLVAADFTARGVEIPVLFGGFKLSEHKGASRVMIALAPYSFESPTATAPAGAPGTMLIDGSHAAQIAAWYAAQGHTLPDAYDGFEARSLFACVETVEVWCFAEPNPDPKIPGRTVAANKAAAKLRNLTAAALHRAAHGSFSLSLGGGDWVNSNRVEGVVYGSLTMFRASFWVPVLDDARPLVTGDPDAAIGKVSFGPADTTVVVTPS